MYLIKPTEKADRSTGSLWKRLNSYNAQLPVKLSVKGLFRCLVKCFKWKTSAVARSSNYYKLRKSSRWSSSFVKCPAVFQIPAAGNERFVFRLSCRKLAGFHGQQLGRFSLNLVFQILFFFFFIYSLKPNFCHKFEFSVISVEPLSSWLMFWQAFVSLTNQINFEHTYQRSDWSKLACFIGV